MLGRAAGGAAALAGTAVFAVACGSGGGSTSASVVPAKTVVRTVTVPPATTPPVTAPAPGPTRVIVISPSPAAVAPAPAAPAPPNPRVYVSGSETEAQQELIGESWNGYTCSASEVESIATVWSASFNVDAAGCPGNLIMNLYTFNTAAEANSFQSAFNARNGSAWTIFDTGTTPSGRAYVAVYHNG